MIAWGGYPERRPHVTRIPAYWPAFLLTNGKKSYSFSKTVELSPEPISIMLLVKAGERLNLRPQKTGVEEE
jgi:hypothetical protein